MTSVLVHGQQHETGHTDPEPGHITSQDQMGRGCWFGGEGAGEGRCSDLGVVTRWTDVEVWITWIRQTYPVWVSGLRCFAWTWDVERLWLLAHAAAEEPTESAAAVATKTARASVASVTVISAIPPLGCEVTLEFLGKRVE